MAWYTVEEYAKLEGVTIQGVYKRIQKSKVKTMRGEHGQNLVWLDLKQSTESMPIKEANALVDESVNTQIETIKAFFESLVKEIKIAKDNEIETLKESIETMKGHYNKVEMLKDKQIEELKTEIERLKGKGFLKRLFGE